MIEFNATLLVQIINFAVFLMIMRVILFGPIIKSIQDRRNYLADSEKKITDGLAKLEEAEKNFQQQLDGARQKAQDLINQNISAAEAEKQEIVKSAIAETHKVLADFKAELDTETQKVRTSLQSEIDSLAQEITGRIIDNRPEEKLAVQGGTH